MTIDDAKDVDGSGQSLDTEVSRERLVMERGSSQAKQGPILALYHHSLLRTVNDRKLTMSAMTG